jgi:putative aminopeptidase FrvX
MAKLDLAMIAELCNTWGPSGCEHVIRNRIAAYAPGDTLSLHTDALGNLVVRTGNPEGRRIMLSAHMDEIGLVVTHIDDKGFLRFSTVGGVPPLVALGQRVRFENGTVGAVACERVDDVRDIKVDKLFIDIGAKDKEDAATRVTVGDACSYDQTLTCADGRLTGKALDDRIGCAVLLTVIQHLADTPYDAHFVFSVQEEVGCRGAQTAAYHIAPEIALAVDVTGTGDNPAAATLPTALGKGAAIKVMDSSVITHPKVRRFLLETAEAAGIPHQLEVLPHGGTDAGPAQRSRAGVLTGAVSIPLRYVHTPHETALLSDFEACVDLLLHALARPFTL